VKTLVIFYSRTGTTRTVAEAIARQLGADIEEIRDTRNRQGLFGYLRSGFDAGLGRCTGLEPMRRDPNDYDVVVVGTPVWNASVSAPVRTFLAAKGRRFKNCILCDSGWSWSTTRVSPNARARRPQAHDDADTDRARSQTS
jgi:flavodoxin